MKTTLAILSFFLLSISTHADTIGVGLDWRKNIFLQEYWQAGKPRYLIANLGKDPVKVAVYEWKARKKGDKLAGPWEIKAKDVADVDAAPLKDQGLMQFEVGDDFLGLLAGPKAPEQKKKKTIFSYEGLNGSGGRYNDIWYEQEKLDTNSEGVITVDLVLEGPKGIITFKKAKSIEQLPEALIQEARSETLPIQSTDAEIKIDTTKPTKDATPHRITLKFKAPKVEGPTLAAIDAWVALSQGGGFHAIRGVLVKPAK